MTNWIIEKFYGFVLWCGIDVSHFKSISVIFFSICLRVKMKVSNVSIFGSIIWVTLLIERPQEDEKNETFPDSEKFICKEKLNTQIWLDCICACALVCFLWWKLSSASANSAAMTPYYAISQIVSCLDVFSFVLLILWIRNAEIWHFCAWQAIIGEESKRSPQNGFHIDFCMAPNQFEFSLPNCMFLPSFMLSSNFE